MGAESRISRALFLLTRLFQYLNRKLLLSCKAGEEFTIVINTSIVFAKIMYKYLFRFININVRHSPRF